MNIKASIILIAYNKYPQILYTLYSLQKQTYDQTKMEVILVDDCSTDSTASLSNYKAPFPFKYIRSEQKLDRAGAKNLGIKNAEGETIIFLDGEMLVDPFFVAKHMRHYHTAKDVAVSATSGHFLTFSVLYPTFTPEQIGLLHFLLRHEPLLVKQVAARLKIPYGHVWDFARFLQFALSNQQAIPLLSKEGIEKQRYKKLALPLPSFPQITKKFTHHLSGYHLAWMFFITRNVSVRKSSLEYAGPFSEEFKGWGYEDWEMGYRLYKSGVKIIEDPEIVSYHQEHPFSTADRRKEQLQNYLKLVNLHPHIEVCASTLDLLGRRNLLQVNDIIEDYYLVDKNPHQFNYVKQAFIRLTKQIPFLLSRGEPVTQLLRRAGIEKEHGGEKMLESELNTLRRTGKYIHFLSALDLLMAL